MKNKKSPPKNEINELKQGWQRTQADFDNFKKRVEKEKQTWNEEGKLEAFNKIIPVLDNLVAATNHLPQDLLQNSWVQGILFISKQIEQSLEDIGISRIVPQIADKFDPNFHEAVGSEKNDQVDSGCIISVENIGYKTSEKIIRPARVKVGE
jgi:molecular chaperone GrpE